MDAHDRSLDSINPRSTKRWLIGMEGIGGNILVKVGASRTSDIAYSQVSMSHAFLT